MYAVARSACDQAAMMGAGLGLALLAWEKDVIRSLAFGPDSTLHLASDPALAPSRSPPNMATCSSSMSSRSVTSPGSLPHSAPSGRRVVREAF